MSYINTAFILLELEEISKTAIDRLQVWFWNENHFLVFENFVKSLWILKWNTCTNPVDYISYLSPLPSYCRYHFCEPTLN